MKKYFRGRKGKVLTVLLAAIIIAGIAAAVAIIFGNGSSEPEFVEDPEAQGEVVEFTAPVDNFETGSIDEIIASDSSAQDKYYELYDAGTLKATVGKYGQVVLYMESALELGHAKDRELDALLYSLIYYSRLNKDNVREAKYTEQLGEEKLAQFESTSKAKEDEKYDGIE